MKCVNYRSLMEVKGEAFFKIMMVYKLFKCDSSISVGLAINRRLVLGIVSVPMIGHTYTAIKGKGAFLNGDQVTVSSDFSSTFNKG
jgi:hypothetical protein